MIYIFFHFLNFLFKYFLSTFLKMVATFLQNGKCASVAINDQLKCFTSLHSTICSCAHMLVAVETRRGHMQRRDSLEAVWCKSVYL